MPAMSLRHINMLIDIHIWIRNGSDNEGSILVGADGVCSIVRHHSQEAALGKHLDPGFSSTF